MIIKYIKDLLGSEEKKPQLPFLSVDRGRFGVETFIHPELEQLPEAYKEQVISFLEGVIKQIQK